MASKTVPGIRPLYSPNPEVALRPGYLPWHLTPVDDIEFTYEVDLQSILIAYAGVGQRLLEAGAVEHGMLERARAKGNPRTRLDCAGHRFNREARFSLKLGGVRHIITRTIADPIFACSLPGMPPVIRFNLFDWLDTHPGQLYREEELRELDDKEVVDQLTLAGRQADLVSADIPSSYFAGKKFARVDGENRMYGEGVQMPGYCHADVSRLMCGYVMVELTSERRPAEKARPTQSPRKALRLVVDNTVQS
jgi:hypothetical protein